ncbi:unnamed protein product [Leptidea sinapis]|uniref:Uncharacterized protein n=1 Tax=Leptidea sinapis TaxID=189913 RepID=A0A5E4Q0J3_9NEOP|nr:unnamed protein product [Leptidea sinapis]
MLVRFYPIVTRIFLFLEKTDDQNWGRDVRRAGLVEESAFTFDSVQALRLILECMDVINGLMFVVKISNLYLRLLACKDFFTILQLILLRVK